MSEFPRIFAHRGASSLAPENTIAAFAKAMEVGARWFEFDVDITGDGSLIVIHDDTLDRTTTGSGSYYQLGFSDIRRLDAGRWFSDTYRFERIPEATDVLAFAHAQQMGANLEIKPCAGGDRLRERLIEALAVTLAGDKVPSRLIVSSFDHDLLAAFHEACPTVALGWLIERASEEWHEGAAALGATAIHPGVEGLTESDVRAMRDAGFEVNVWTVNDVEQAGLVGRHRHLHGSPAGLPRRGSEGLRGVGAVYGRATTHKRRRGPGTLTRPGPLSRLLLAALYSSPARRAKRLETCLARDSSAIESTTIRPPTMPAKRIQPERGEEARTAATSMPVPTIASAATAA